MVWCLFGKQQMCLCFVYGVVVVLEKGVQFDWLGWVDVLYVQGYVLVVCGGVGVGYLFEYLVVGVVGYYGVYWCVGGQCVQGGVGEVDYVLWLVDLFGFVEFGVVIVVVGLGDLG